MTHHTLPRNLRPILLACIAASVPCLAAAPQDAPPVAATGDSYVFHFPDGDDAMTLRQLVSVAVEMDGRTRLWNEATDVAMKSRKVRLIGEKVVAKERVSSFVSALMLVSGFTSTDSSVSGVDLSVIELQPKPEGDTAGSELLRKCDDGSFVLEMPVGAEERNVTVLEFARAFASATGASITWAGSTEARMASEEVRLVGRRSIRADRIDEFFRAVLLVAQFDARQVSGAGTTVWLVEPYGASTSSGGESDGAATKPAITKTARGGDYVLNFSHSDEDEETISAFQFLLATQDVSGESITFDDATAAKLRKTKVFMQGTCTVSQEGFVEFSEVVLGALGFEMAASGDGEVQVLVVRERSAARERRSR